MPARPRWKRLDPFAGLEHPREVWAWGMYDLANQSFTLLINTLLFAVYFRDVVVADEGRGDALWGAVVGVSLALVVVLSPLAGALADALAAKKRMLIGLGAGCVAFTCGLALIPADQPGRLVWLAALLYVPANVCFAVGENFLASFLPEIAGRREMCRVSAIGWTMGYVGALALLGLTAALMAIFAWDDPAQWRPLFLFAGLWFLVMATPTALFLRERARREPIPGSVAGVAFGRIAETVRHAARYGQLLRFLAIFFVYSMGVQSMIFFAAIIANGFGYEGVRLSLFLLPVTVFAGVGAAATGPMQRRFGYRRAVHAHLAVWTLTGLGLVALAATRESGGGLWLLWIVACLMGLALGGIGTASRAMVGVLTPAHKTAEFFGLWGLAYKLAGVVGVVIFGAVKGADELAAYGLLVGVFVVGFLGLFLVGEARGTEAAERAERDHAAEIDAADHAAAASIGPGPIDDLP
jgi:UMF1 family MFS transporter